MILVKLKVAVIGDIVNWGYLGCKAQSTDCGQCVHRMCSQFKHYQNTYYIELHPLVMLNCMPLFTLSACRLFWKTFSTALYLHQLFIWFLSSIVGWLTNVDMKIWLLSAILLSELLFYMASVLIHFGHLHHVDDHLFTHCGQWWCQPLMKIQKVTWLLPKFLFTCWFMIVYTLGGERRMRDNNKISNALFLNPTCICTNVEKVSRNKWEARFPIKTGNYQHCCRNYT